MQVANAFVKYIADTKDLEKQLGPAGAVATQGQKTATTVGSRFKTAFSTTATVAAGTGGVFFATAIEGATKLEDQMRTVNTVAGLSDSELSGLTDSVQALSRETGASTDDLTAGLYDLVSAGVPAADAIDVLRDSAKLGIGALGSTASSVDAVTSALNAYELGADKSGHVTDVLAKAVADGKVTIDQIGASIAQVAPIAASAGISLEEVSAGYAELTAKGVPAAQAATQMRAAIASLLTPNEQLNKIQKETGINFAELAKEKGLAVALEELRKATGGSAEEFGKALGSVEAYQFALATTGENAEGFAAQIEETMNAAGVAQGQYDEKSKSALEQGKRFFATMNTFAQDVGGPFVGALGQGVFALNQLGTAFGLPVSPAKLLGGVIGGLVGKGAMLSKSFGKAIIPKLLGGLVGVIPALTPALGGIGAAIPTIIAAAMAAWPVILVAAIVAGIVFLANNPEIVDKIIEFGEGLLAAISSFLEQLPDLFFQAFDAAMAAVGTAIEKLPEILAAVIPAVIGFIGKLGELFLRLHFKILEIMLGLVSRVVGLILSIPGRVAGWVGSLLAQGGRILAGVNAKIQALAASVVAKILSIPGRIVSWVGSILGQVGQIASQTGAKIVAMAAAVVREILAIPMRAIGWISSFLSGVGRAVSGMIARIGSMAGSVVRTILGIPGKIIPGLVNGFARAAQQAAKAFLDGIAGLPGAVGDAVGGVGNFLGGLVPKFDVGALEIPHDMLAVVHAGEMIVPAAEAEAIRSGRSSLGAQTVASFAGALEGAGGGPTTIHIPFAGALPVREPSDLVYEMQRLEADGVIPPKRRPPMYDRKWTQKK